MTCDPLPNDTQNADVGGNPRLSGVMCVIVLDFSVQIPLCRASCVRRSEMLCVAITDLRCDNPHRRLSIIGAAHFMV